MIRRTSRSTLFPYTTLFRSDRGGAEQRAARKAQVQPAGSARARRPAIRVRRSRDGLSQRAGRGGDADARADRKSTRLNSSHVEISYAVFCLKKNRFVLYHNY